MLRTPRAIRRLVAALTLAVCGTAAADLTPPANVAATDGTLVTAVRVEWSAVEGATGYRVFRRMGTQPPMMVGISPSPSFNDNSAIPGMVFKYSVRAIAGATQSPPSAEDEGWRNVPAPGNLVASDGTNPNGVALQWMPSPGAAGYRVYRGTSESDLAEIAMPNQPGFLDATATAGTVYTYVVRAKTAAGNSAPSNTDTGFRGNGGGGNPPTGVNATDGTRTDGVAVSWSMVANAEGYRVFRGNGPGAPTEIGTPSEPTFLDITANPGVVYSYSVKARFASGDSNFSLPNTGWRNVPAPANLAATDGTLPNGVGLSWTGVEQAIGYRVFRSQGSNPPIQVAMTTAPNHLDISAAPGVTYTYVVKARTPAGDSAPSESDTGYRGQPAPGNLIASDGRSAMAVELRWTPMTGVVGYRVFRSLGDAEPAEIATPAAPYFNDTTAVPGTVYSYRICGRNADGSNTAFSNSDTGWRNVPAPTALQASDGTSSAAVNLTWNAVNGATGYRVFRSVGPATPTEVGTPETNAFADETAVAGIRYTYRVCARTSAGNSNLSNPDLGFRNVAAPTGVAASDGTFADKVVVSWTAVDGAAVNGYVIFRRLEGQANAAPIGAVNGGATTSFNDLTIPVNVVGTYTVRARTAAGLSTASETDTGFRVVAAFAGSGAGFSGGGSPVDRTSVAAPVGGGTSSARAASPKAGAPAASAGGEPFAGDQTSDRVTTVAPAEECGRLSIRLDALIRDLAASGDATLVAISESLAGLDADAPCRMARGDVNLDGAIDAADVTAFLESWTAGDLVLGDLNRDGSVDEFDLALFGGSLAEPIAATAD
jgi:fibronectin type 3 domain-containing protein